MTIQVIVCENSKDKYQLVLRNASVYDLAVKIVNTNPGIKMDQKHYNSIILSKRWNIFKFDTLAKYQITNSKLSDFHIYTRAIYPYNRKNVALWLKDSTPVKPQHCAKSLKFVCDPKQFTASKIIVDLPGKSAMAESTGYALKMKDSKDVLRAFIENDTDIAKMFDVESVSSAKGKTPKKENSSKKVGKKKSTNSVKKQEDSCFLLPCFQSFCAAPTAVMT